MTSGKIFDNIDFTDLIIQNEESTDNIFMQHQPEQGFSAPVNAMVPTTGQVGTGIMSVQNMAIPPVGSVADLTNETVNRKYSAVQNAFSHYTVHMN